MVWIRLFSPDEANALLPELVPLVQEAKRLHESVAEAEAHVNDLRIIWGPELDDPKCRDHGEYRTRQAEVEARRLRLAAHVKQITDHGVEVKDPASGLLDFYTLNGDRLAYLCWQEGEEKVAHWHSLRGGFARRKPLPDLGEEKATR